MSIIFIEINILWRGLSTALHKKNITALRILSHDVFPIQIKKTKRKIVKLLICTPKVRHFWRCIFLWQRKDKNIENTRQNSNYLL